MKIYGYVVMTFEEGGNGMPDLNVCSFKKKNDRDVSLKRVREMLDHTQYVKPFTSDVEDIQYSA